MSSGGERGVVVIGGGPAGLTAAEMLSSSGHAVDVFDAMPSLGRKFLLAGIGGLNLTHSEAPDAFASRYRERRPEFERLLATFGATALRDWAHGLGVETFVGSSGRVFPVGMKAAPLLRAWLRRLREAGVRFHVRHRWLGWQAGDALPTHGLRFATPAGERLVDADAVVLALGGASWARLGSDGAWVPWLGGRNVTVAALKAANCGFDVATQASSCGEGREGWSEHFRAPFAGQPLKSVALSFTDAHGETHHRAGECMVSATGLEGSLIYALSAPLRDTLAANGTVELSIDLAPGRTLERLTEELSRPRGARSMSSHLQSKVGIAGVKAGLLRECLPRDAFASPARLAAAIHALPLRLAAPRPLDEAISTAGGVVFEELDEGLMIRKLPGMFCCGEMLDWEAPTGGYLLTGCFATGRAAGLGASAWLASAPRK
ncbi:conserved hypothetical protein, probable flavoprotein [Aromatoleum aromaticum EbN1]|uniref:Uncharacterized protein n=1 Tax=Aromatoleum aromaticum (strain DSM 19018 / LMG 30748 / EbN1) TaxID=76114 RepID=Q5P2M9_AROAE|nr:TIGR03862 family flavoprotein [Aromatoleum aromaticum]CAI08435.1 conserved hypothetical protein, probable flavoprotein [Aromatoleum aromaticum EbN1]